MNKQKVRPQVLGTGSNLQNICQLADFASAQLGEIALVSHILTSVKCFSEIWSTRTHTQGGSRPLVLETVIKVYPMIRQSSYTPLSCIVVLRDLLYQFSKHTLTHTRWEGRTSCSWGSERYVAQGGAEYNGLSGYCRQLYLYCVAFYQLAAIVFVLHCIVL